MTARATGVGIDGIEGVLVDVQVGTQAGLPGIDITGLPATTIREARYRVRSALKAASYEWPGERLIANFAPADLPKAGTAYDLPLAMAVLALDNLVLRAALEGCVFYGELALDGGVRGVPGTINAALAARAGGRRAIYVAASAAAEAAAVPGLEVFPVSSLVELVEALHGRAPLTATQARPGPSVCPPAVDLCHVRGQIRARRALEVAAAGGHNLLMVGPPGCGKTLLARALPGILPPLTLDEALEVSRIHSVAGLRTVRAGLVRARPFRAPHSTASDAALIGGGNPPKPGEVSLAHRGVLFMDEVAEFRRQALESLRAPLEDRSVVVSRAGRSARFPASLSLVCAMNPCPCGYKGDARRACRCVRTRIDAYRARLSGPLLDRIDITVHLASVSPEELAEKPAGEPSGEVRARVVAARERQAERGENTGVGTNAELGLADLDAAVVLGEAETRYLARASRRLGLSARAWHRVVRVARTIADLAGARAISRLHLGEALTYRTPWMDQRRTTSTGAPQGGTHEENEANSAR